MIHQFINANKIIEARIIEPVTLDKEHPFDPEKHGWQVLLITSYQTDGYPNSILVDKLSEQDCLNFCNELGLRFIF